MSELKIKRQWREIGETEWEDCNKDWFDYCCYSPNHDTRLAPKEDITQEAGNKKPQLSGNQNQAKG